MTIGVTTTRNRDGLPSAGSWVLEGDGHCTQEICTYLRPWNCWRYQVQLALEWGETQLHLNVTEVKITNTR